MARLLTAQGEEVALLALFNTPAPGSLRWWPLNLNYLNRRILHELREVRARGIRPKLRILGVKSARLAGHSLGFFKAALGGAFAKSSLPSIKPWTEGILTVSDANVAAAKAYRPRPYTGQITLFSTQEVSKYYAIDPREGWLPFAAGGMDLHAVEGDNHCLFDPPFNTRLAEQLKRCIERASDPMPASTPAAA
jgi:thioesterase domain-containing protein